MPQKKHNTKPYKALPNKDVTPSFIEPPGPDEAARPRQKEHFALPVRFVAVPVDYA